MVASFDAIRTWYAEAKRLANYQRLMDGDAIRTWYAEAKQVGFGLRRNHDGCNPRVVR